MMNERKSKNASVGVKSKVLLITFLMVTGVLLPSCRKNQAKAPDVQTFFNTSADRTLSTTNQHLSAMGFTVPTLMSNNHASGSMFSLNSYTSRNFDCSQSFSGNADDADGDGFPVDVSYDFECSHSSPEANVSVSGKLRVRDKNDSDPRGGYRIETLDPDNMRWTISFSSGTYEHVLDFVQDVTVSGGRYTYDTWTRNVTFSYGGQSCSQSVDGSGFSFTPDSDGNYDPWDSFTANGTINMNINCSGSANSATVTFNNVHFADNESCPVDGGSITFESNGHSCTVTITGCGSVSYSGDMCPTSR